MNPTYKQSDLSAAIWDSKIEQNASSQIDLQSIMNYAVREVIKDLDLRSTKRLSAVIAIFNDIYDVTCPADMKSQKIIDLIPQVNRASNFETTLTTAEEFDRRKSFDKQLVAFNDHDMMRKLRVAVIVNNQQLSIASLDTLSSGGGTWILSGDATNVRVDNVNFVEGSGSIAWDIGTGGTGKAGIANIQLTNFDLTNYLSQGSVFSWVYIPSTTSLTSFTITLGGISAFHQITVTSTNEGNAFSVGWNLLRFDFVNQTVVGTPLNSHNTAITLYANSSPAITSSTGWRFDSIILANGVYNNVSYYTKLGWQDASTNAYKENSAIGGDYLNADTEEFDLFVLRGKMESDRRLRDWNAYTTDKQAYAEAKASYLEMYYSEAKPLTTTTYDTAASLNYNTDLDSITSIQEGGPTPPLT